MVVFPTLIEAVNAPDYEGFHLALYTTSHDGRQRFCGYY